MKNQQTKLEKITSDRIFYNDQLAVSSYPANLDDQYLIDTNRPCSNPNKQEKHKKRLRLLHNTNDCGVNKRIIKQFEIENYELFQITKLQQKKIELLEKHVYKISGGRMFF